MQMANETDQEYSIRCLEEDIDIRSRIYPGYASYVEPGYSEDEQREKISGGNW